MVTTFNFDTIYIVESLQPHERKTGQNLFQHLKSRNYSIQYFDVREESALRGTLAIINQQTLNGKMPLLHIEAHGGEAGLKLADSNTIEWKTLGDWIAPINESTKNNLLVVFAACKGFISVRQFVQYPNERIPYFATLGVEENIIDTDLENRFQKFYDKLLISLKIEDALKSSNENETNTFFFESADRMLLGAIQSAIKKLKDMDLGPMADLVNTPALRQKVIRRYIEKYLMLDLDSTNKTRFKEMVDQAMLDLTW